MSPLSYILKNTNEKKRKNESKKKKVSGWTLSSAVKKHMVLLETAVSKIDLVVQFVVTLFPRNLMPISSTYKP